MVTLHKYWLVPYILCGILLGVGFVYPLVWVLAVVGVAGLFSLIKTEQDKKHAYIGTILAWVIKYGFALSWFWSAYPIKWLPVVAGGIQLPIIFFYFLTTALWLSLGAVVLVFLTDLTKQVFPKRTTIIYIVWPFAWVGAEVVGALLFSIFTYGAGAQVSAAFSFGMLGYLLAEHQLLLHIAQLAGVYGLSFVGAVLGVGLFRLGKVVSMQHRYVLVAVLLIVWVSAGGTAPLLEGGTSGKTVAVVDTQFPLVLLQDRSNMYIQNALSQAVAAAIEHEVDYIILPEDARFFDQTKDPQIEKSFFQFQYKQPPVIIVDSGSTEVDDEHVIQSFIFDGKNNEVYQPQKRYLVPQGEFMPYLYAGVLRFFGFGELVEKIQTQAMFTVGQNTTQTNIKKEVPGVLFCFESVSPWGVRKILTEHPQLPFIAHPVSHAWFHEPTILWHQLDTMLRVQAVWNGVYIVSAGNHVPGKVVTPNGGFIRAQTIAKGEYWKVRVATIAE